MGLNYQVVELGCGEGSLLGFLAQPASYLDDFTPTVSLAPDTLSTAPESTIETSCEVLMDRLSLEKTGVETAIAGSTRAQESEGDPTSSQSVTSNNNVEELQLADILRRLPALELYEQQLHIRKVYGLDLLERRLKQAAMLTAPPATEVTNWMFAPSARWEPLVIELWHGSLIQYIKSFEDGECIVMSEVIEHLPPDVFDKFAPIVFGAYKARVIIITTPNHDFNRYFDASASQSIQHRFPDPTGRTSRVFRDDDHKFEWTEDEFKQWCDEISQTYGFDVEITGCGSHANYFGRYSMDIPSRSSPPYSSTDVKPEPASCLTEPTSPPTNPGEFYATQCAIFRKRSSREPERSTVAPKSPTATSQTSSAENEPVLFQTHIHPVDPHADQPATTSEILDQVRKIFKDSSRGSVDFRELWYGHPHIPQVCGGRAKVLISSLLEDKDEWGLELDDRQRGIDALKVRWKPYVSPSITDSEVSSEDGSDDEESAPPSHTELSRTVKETSGSHVASDEKINLTTPMDGEMVLMEWEADVETRDVGNVTTPTPWVLDPSTPVESEVIGQSGWGDDEQLDPVTALDRAAQLAWES